MVGDALKIVRRKGGKEKVVALADVDDKTVQTLLAGHLCNLAGINATSRAVGRLLGVSSMTAAKRISRIRERGLAEPLDPIVGLRPGSWSPTTT